MTSEAAWACCVMCRALQGQYKWLLYGDDDTIWFVNGVLELAGKLDSSMPYIVTGTAVLAHFHTLFEGAQSHVSHIALARLPQTVSSRDTQGILRLPDCAELLIFDLFILPSCNLGVPLWFYIDRTPGHQCQSCALRLHMDMISQESKDCIARRLSSTTHTLIGRKHETIPRSVVQKVIEIGAL